MPKVSQGGYSKYPSSKDSNSNFYLKRTLQIRDVLKQIDSSKILFPRGFMTRIAKTIDTDCKVKRVELFAKKDKDTYGIIRNFHVAYCNERSLLLMADVTTSVISVRAVDNGNRISDIQKRVLEDRLVLKRSERDESKSDENIVPFRLRQADISVSSAWLEKVKLSKGARLLVSNPIETYAVVPPNVA